MEFTNFLTPAPSVLKEDSDESFLKHSSLYATLRQEDLDTVLESRQQSNVGDFIPSKNTSKRSHLSLQDLYSMVHVREKTPFSSDEKTLVIMEDGRTVTEAEVLTVKDDHDLPIEYTVHSIESHEFPVKGFYVDRRICPGFRYKVRYVSRSDDVFDGKGRYLTSIGMGYGKRLTFKGDKLNVNDCFFWSDSDEDGYAFSHDVLEGGQKFVLYDSNSQAIGEVVIESATELPQVEDSMETSSTSVKKIIRVQFACVINYHSRLHGNLVEVHNQEIQILEGIAEVVKQRREREAQVVCIRNINLHRIGECTLWKE